MPGDVVLAPLHRAGHAGERVGETADLVVGRAGVEPGGLAALDLLHRAQQPGQRAGQTPPREHGEEQTQQHGDREPGSDNTTLLVRHTGVRAGQRELQRGDPDHLAVRIADGPLSSRETTGWPRRSWDQLSDGYVVTAPAQENCGVRLDEHEPIGLAPEHLRLGAFRIAQRSGCALLEQLVVSRHFGLGPAAPR